MYQIITFLQAKDWIELLYSLRASRRGYKRANVTPYMHILPYHAPNAMKNFGNVKQFTGQGNLLSVWFL